MFNAHLMNASYSQVCVCMLWSDLEAIQQNCNSKWFWLQLNHSMHQDAFQIPKQIRMIEKRESKKKSNLSIVRRTKMF